MITFLGLNAQTISDSIYALEPVQINLYASDRHSFFSPSSIYTLDDKVLGQQVPYALVSGVNTVPGVRMEERSPGSYRLSIRGSLLRSPFGVRNIKVYIDEFPLTDAGGNTYLNALDPGSVQKIELVKGPEGSIYGANMGGVMVIHPRSYEKAHCKASAVVGSYGLLQQQLSYQKNTHAYRFKVYQGLQRSEGYRQHSAMQRYFGQGSFTLNYARGRRLKFLGMYSNLGYQTPGGLNASQWEANPRAARPAAGSIPGAEVQQAGIYNKLYFGGIAHTTDLGSRMHHMVSVFGSISDFKNPFITNYEVRKEGSWGLRTYLKASSPQGSNKPWEAYIGLEAQQTQSFIDNYGNRRGLKDTMQTANGLKALQHFYYARFVKDLSRRWVLETALSINYYTYTYKNYFPNSADRWHLRKFDQALMPKLASSYRFSSKLVGRFSISRGFSPPTIAEVRPSDMQIYERLQAEQGWNYEAGLRWRGFENMMKADVTLFYMAVNQAIVRQVNSSGAEYFINAGKTSQPGLEAQITAQLWKGKSRDKHQKLTWNNSFTYYRFKFVEYNVAGLDASGHKLTGVPDFTYVSSIQLDHAAWSFYLQHNYTSAIPLNDANTVKAEPYHLMQAKIGYTLVTKESLRMGLQIGADNILNQKYSLGNDLNAFGGRYFNTAAPRNYYIKLSIDI